MLFCSWIRDRTLGQSTCWIKWPWKSFLGTALTFNGVDISSSIEKPIINTFPLLFELGKGNSWVIWCYKTLIVLTKKKKLYKKMLFSLEHTFLSEILPSSTWSCFVLPFFYFHDYISDGSLSSAFRSYQVHNWKFLLQIVNFQIKSTTDEACSKTVMNILITVCIPNSIHYKLTSDKSNIL